MTSQGRYGIIFGPQTSAWFETVDAVNTCYGYGQRISQLSYNLRSRVADGAFEPHDGGVSEYGQQVIERINQIGVSQHVNGSGYQLSGKNHSDLDINK